MDRMVPRGGFRLLSRQLQRQRLTLRPAGSFRQWHSTPTVGQQNEQATKSSSSSSEKTTDFGFETIAESLKTSRVGEVFSSVAESYDSMNDFMSLGIHRLWKDYFVRGLDPGAATPGLENPGWKILDVAGGTGDIAFRMLDHASKIHGDAKTQVTVADINADMLAAGQKRARETRYHDSGRLNFLEANAEDLSMIPSNSQDLYTVAFGIRNFTNKPAALREAFRVLKPGGVFACLEFSKVQNPLFDAVYKRWSFGAIPMIGQLVAGDRDSYQYLVESIDRFPSQEEFRAMMKEAGFAVVGDGYENLTNGIAAIHKGLKPLT